jgi:hypothetical protein
MAKTHGDVLKAKQKRQKLIAAVGGVILLGLLAFQVPRVMARLHRKPPASVAAPSAPATAPTEQAPAASTPNPSSTQLADSSAPVGDGQLASFSRFSSKDPFQQQVPEGVVGADDNTNPEPTSGSGASKTPAASGSTSRGSGTGASGSSGSSGSSTDVSGSSGSSGSSDSSSQESSSGSSADSTPATATFSVNGRLVSVAPGEDFPQATSGDSSALPLFRLVSLKDTTAKIAIAGGSFTDGAKAVTVQVNEPVTLLNTVDGTRYRLVLKPAGTAVPDQG